MSRSFFSDFTKMKKLGIHGPNPGPEEFTNITLATWSHASWRKECLGCENTLFETRVERVLENWSMSLLVSWILSGLIEKKSK